MARLVKKTKKVKRNLDGIYMMTFILAFILYLVSSLFISNLNNSLATQVQKVKSETATLELQNNAIAVETQKLLVSDRINKIANKKGLTRNQANITTVQTPDTKMGE
ncbi:MULTISPECIES: hypothetical protein [Terrabacteria group]|uniref:hypothetical protein n=1 Tax=Bacillati TaxID=1783272 RepID=UPI00193A1CE3|nr:MULTISPECIES: hypothetical protein [Terrabacteria group]MBW9212293.1 hypothetical protein [Trueperella sp. zg.1013]QRG86168.1 hypothetical protein JOS54_04655 [Bulleidia sp. zg-1006]